MEVVVTSFGGVGTTFLMSFLSKYKNINDPVDTDGFKHSPLPPISLNSNIKFIYIYGNPTLAAISLFRRNFHYYQSEKLQRWCMKTGSSIPRKMTIQEYASLGIERFQFSRHFYNWYDKYLVHPTIFIRYEKMFDHIEELLDFVDIPKAYIDYFPPQKDRTSTEENFSIQTLKQLNNMYCDFSEELAKLDDVEIRKPINPTLSSRLYLKNIYLKALLRQEISVLYSKVRKN